MQLLGVLGHAAGVCGSDTRSGVGARPADPRIPGTGSPTRPAVPLRRIEASARRRRTAVKPFAHGRWSATTTRCSQSLRDRDLVDEGGRDDVHVDDRAKSVGSPGRRRSRRPRPRVAGGWRQLTVAHVADEEGTPGVRCHGCRRGRTRGEVRASKTVTSCPSASQRSHVWDPMKFSARDKDLTTVLSSGVDLAINRRVLSAVAAEVKSGARRAEPVAAAWLPATGDHHGRSAMLAGSSGRSERRTAAVWAWRSGPRSPRDTRAIASRIGSPRSRCAIDTRDHGSPEKWTVSSSGTSPTQSRVGDAYPSASALSSPTYAASRPGPTTTAGGRPIPPRERECLSRPSSLREGHSEDTNRTRTGPWTRHLSLVNLARASAGPLVITGRGPPPPG